MKTDVVKRCCSPENASGLPRTWPKQSLRVILIIMSHCEMQTATLLIDYNNVVQNNNTKLVGYTVS